MVLLLLLGYAAGLLTLLNPCVLPIVPVVAASALHENRNSPIFIAIGLSFSTCFAGFFIALTGHKFGINQSFISNVGALFLIMFGFLVLLPVSYSPFTSLNGPVAGIIDWTTKLNGSNAANTAAGAALGLAWSPCIGPTMGTAVALASTGKQLSLSIAIMLTYALGVGTIFLLLSYGGNKVIQARKIKFRAHSNIAFNVFGLISILVGFSILFGIHKALEYWLIGIMPDWLISLSVKF